MRALSQLAFQGCVALLLELPFRSPAPTTKGTDTALMIAGEPHARGAHYRQAFEAAYRREFGFVLQGRDVVVDDVRVRVVAPSVTAPLPAVPAARGALQPALLASAVFAGVGRVATPVFLLRVAPSFVRGGRLTALCSHTRTWDATPPWRDRRCWPMRTTPSSSSHAARPS